MSEIKLSWLSQNIAKQQHILGKLLVSELLAKLGEVITEKYLALMAQIQLLYVYSGVTVVKRRSHKTGMLFGSCAAPMWCLEYMIVGRVL